VYHVIRPSHLDDNEEVRSIAQTPETFDAQLTYLKVAGYTVVRFNDLEAYLTTGTPLPPNPIILSFDDGWSSQYTYAFPILKKHNYPATFFLFTNGIGRPSFVSWENVRELIGAGMTIGDHSRSHPYLTQITDQEALWREIDGSKKFLEKELGVEINEFAYPFGRYTPEIVAMVKNAGYKSARGDFYTGSQSYNKLYELSAMNAPTTTELFAKKFPMR